MDKVHVAGSSKASTKRILITKTQSQIVAATAGAAFVLVFSLFAAKALIGQAMYQNRVISAKKEAVGQLQDNLDAIGSLTSAYKGFVNSTPNVLGGNPTGTGPQDGDNAKVVLDALPSKYDFPALTASLEKLLTAQNMQIQSITGTDEEVAQTNPKSAASAKPQPIPIPFQITATGNYQATQNLVTMFQLSIRPFKVKTMQVSGNEGKMTITVTADAYYQPEKNFSVGTETVE